MRDFMPRLRSLISAKLGRCHLCMRSALLGTLGAWALVAVLYTWANPILTIAAISVAGAFTALMLGHLGAIAAREVGIRRRFRGMRVSFARSRPAGPSRRQFFGSALTGGTAALGVLLMDLSAGAWTAGAELVVILRYHLQKFPRCNCYQVDDCQKTGRGSKCFWNFEGALCVEVPKPDKFTTGFLPCGGPDWGPSCDGICTGSVFRRITWGQVLVVDVSDAADLYFRAYIEGGMSGDGQPDRSLIARAFQLNLPTNWHLEIIDAVHRALDVTLGWDFMQCTFDKACFGFMPRLSNAAAALLDAAREGLVTGLRDNNPDAPEIPIRTFWSRGEEFHPMHTGRCYPHGHPDQTDPATCQIRELKADLALLLAGRAAARA